MLEVWVPSRWAAQVFVDAGLDEKMVYVVPGTFLISAVDFGGKITWLQRLSTWLSLMWTCGQHFGTPHSLVHLKTVQMKFLSDVHWRGAARRLCLPQHVQVGGPQGACSLCHVCIVYHNVP